MAVVMTLDNPNGWSLQVIEECGDDPNIENPGAFVDALADALHSR